MDSLETCLLSLYSIVRHADMFSRQFSAVSGAVGHDETILLLPFQKIYIVRPACLH